MKRVRFGAGVALLAAAACSGGRDPDVKAPKTIRVTSPDFTTTIPAAFAGKPPRLAWSGLPKGTKELALIVDDPDAPTAEPYVHYVLTSIAPDAKELKGVVGTNESLKSAWEPLAPPAGETHRYFFRLYALDASLGGRPLSKAGVLAAIRGRVLAWGELVGTFGGR